MKKSIKCYLVVTCLLLAFSACKKESVPELKPIKAFKPFTISGFTTEPLEQYFDGVKLRELHGNASIAGDSRLVFENDEILMELKKKGTNEIVYKQTFNIKDASCDVPRFYFDGTNFQPRYTYPAPIGTAYTANFYFDFPKEGGNVDVVLDIMEYYPDANDPYGVGIAGITSTPIATNIQPGKWSSFITLNPINGFPPKTRPDSDFLPFITIKKAGTNTYFTGNASTHPYDRVDMNSFYLTLPESGTTEGLVQSYYIGWQKQNEQIFFNPKVDLVQLFP